MFPVSKKLPVFSCSPYFKPLFPCSPENIACVPLFPKTPGMASLNIKYTFINAKQIVKMFTEV